MFRVKAICGWCAGLAVAGLFVASAAHCQVVQSAEGKGQSLRLGVDFSNLRAGFPIDSSLRLSGVGVFGNLNWSHKYGVEGQIRFLNFNSWNGETEQDYLAGPRFTFLHSSKWRPFAAFEVGAIKIQYPFNVGTGTSFAMAPTGGLDYRVNRKWSVRGAYQYQFLPDSPDFTDEPKFGIRPNGVSVGISYRLF
jgi:opacity protein-like surface antigen